MFVYDMHLEEGACGRYETNTKTNSMIAALLLINVTQKKVPAAATESIKNNTSIIREHVGSWTLSMQKYAPGANIKTNQNQWICQLSNEFIIYLINESISQSVHSFNFDILEMKGFHAR